MRDVFINSFGTFLPGQPVTNNAIEDHIGRIGGKPSPHRAIVLRQNRIKTRHYVPRNDNGDFEYTSAQMAAHALRDAVSKSEATLQDISYLASTTTFGDLMVPGLASHVHAELGIGPIELANFQSVCASALRGLKTATLQVASGEHNCAAVCGSEFSSRYFQPGFYEQTRAYKETGQLGLDADFLRFTLSDGAGAAILENRPNERGLSLKVLWTHIRSFADRFDTCMLAGGVRQEEGAPKAWSHYSDPATAFHDGALMLTQDFELMKKMLPVWVSHYLSLIDEGRIVIPQVDHVVSHYSSHSLRVEVIDLLRKADAMIDEDKWFSNLYSKGNTGSASIFILLEELFNSGRLKRGEKILCHVPESGRALNGFMMLEVV
jgi:3-oxoacyl-[acyl-carrier-protein] synthase-3